MLGIVIANWNGEKIIGSCLKSLSQQTYKNFKVYIIDNNSKDESISIIESYNEKLSIELTRLDYNSGFAVANNIGIKQAIDEGCTYILTLNNDVEVPSRCLAEAMKEVEQNRYDFYQLFMINYFDRKKCDAAGLNFTEQLIPVQIGYRETVENVLSRDKIEIEGVCAGAAIYASKVLEKVKLENDEYFDGNFFAYYEDVDLSLRLRNKGYKAKLLRSAIVYHMHSATSNKMSGLKEYYLMRNLLIYTKRNQTSNCLRKNNYYYYYIFIKKLIRGISNIDVIKSLIKGLIDGINERKLTKSIM